LPQTGHVKTSSAKSWLAVLILASAIFALLWGISRLLGHFDVSAMGLVYEWWSRPLYWAITGLGLLVILAVLGLTMLAMGKGSGDRPAVRRQLLVLGPWVLYLPTCGGSVLAVVGLVSVMVTPFLGGGLLAMAAALVGDSGAVPQDMADWIARGIVGPGEASYGDSPARFLTAEAMVALGLAITLVGFVQILKAWRESRLETGGLYSSVRHPQYLGIALWTFGLAFAVSGVAGYLTWYTVAFLCVGVALWEERRLSPVIPEYEAYRRRTPFMIPFVRPGLPLPESRQWRIGALVAYYLVGLAVVCLILRAIGVEHPHFL
jgi:hypothetical protein